MARVSFRVDDEIKKKAERTFDDIGIKLNK